MIPVHVPLTCGYKKYSYSLSGVSIFNIHFLPIRFYLQIPVDTNFFDIPSANPYDLLWASKRKYGSAKQNFCLSLIIEMGLGFCGGWSTWRNEEIITFGGWCVWNSKEEWHSESDMAAFTLPFHLRLCSSSSSSSSLSSSSSSSLSFPPLIHRLPNTGKSLNAFSFSFPVPPCFLLHSCFFHIHQLLLLLKSV